MSAYRGVPNTVKLSQDRHLSDRAKCAHTEVTLLQSSRLNMDTQEIESDTRVSILQSNLLHTGKEVHITVKYP